MKTRFALPCAMVFGEKYNLNIKCSMLFLWLLLAPQLVNSQSFDNFKTGNHQLTIYVIRSVGPINWESPSTLYKSYINAYLSHILRQKMTLTGHLFIRLSSSLLDEPLYAGMCTPSKKERRVCVLKEKIGLGVLGAGMEAKLENKNDLMQKIEYYSQKGEIAFITYQINESAAQRIIDFYKGFTSKTDLNDRPSDHYGGAFWPRYKNEGAGCSALGMAILEVIGLQEKEAKNWVRKVYIPMSLVGGKYNKMQKVNPGMIRRTFYWHNGSGTENVDYVSFSIYDPSLIFAWIIQQRTLASQQQFPDYSILDESSIPGLSADRRSVKCPEGPIFISRKDSNYFITKYLGNTDH